MSAALPSHDKLSVTSVLARREANAAVRGLGGYIALTLALLVAAWLVVVDIQALDRAGVLVKAEPFRGPLTIAVLILCIFLAVSAAVSTSRDRESGTLEVLFYGPVDERIYVTAKVAGLLLAYVAALPLLLLPFFVMSMISGFMVTPIILVSAVLSIVPAAAIISFGVMLSVGTHRIRTAVLVLAGTIALLIGIKLAYGLVLLIPVADPSSALLALRDALMSLDGLVRWISPFAYLERVVDAGMAGQWWSAAVNSAAVLVGNVAMVAVAVMRLRHRGVCWRGE
jgi:hypothetical protein